MAALTLANDDKIAKFAKISLQITSQKAHMLEVCGLLLQTTTPVPQYTGKALDPYPHKHAITKHAQNDIINKVIVH